MYAFLRGKTKYRVELNGLGLAALLKSRRIKPVLNSSEQNTYANLQSIITKDQSKCIHYVKLMLETLDLACVEA